jgi:hypothetical protein
MLLGPTTQGQTNRFVPTIENGLLSVVTKPKASKHTFTSVVAANDQTLAQAYKQTRCTRVLD